MKILHTDKDETPANELPADQFIQQIQQPASAKDAVIDLSTGQAQQTPVPAPKKNNAWIWGIVILLIVAIIATLVIYFKRKQQKENEHIGN